ncbi:hypothetical protein BLNAU_4836 [Blattamonas nauphoetae]|uniref:Transmembrane protein n=1 Tax=Blattamonas nauphoetae TaxID=2049346 RepID=A0ABQ9Y945_9EUKA|nr:hypothetical protein BLNAU_4836 [Blattamonas nauphoetae]
MKLSLHAAMFASAATPHFVGRRRDRRRVVLFLFFATLLFFSLVFLLSLTSMSADPSSLSSILSLPVASLPCLVILSPSPFVSCSSALLLFFLHLILPLFKLSPS